MELRRHDITTMVVDNMMVNSLVDNTFHDNGDVSKRDLNLHFLMSRFELMRELGVEFRNCDARNFSDLATVFRDVGPTKIVHLSDIDWKVPGDLAIKEYNVGQEIEAKILDFEIDKERISLGIKQLDGDPIGCLLYTSDAADE